MKIAFLHTISYSLVHFCIKEIVMWFFCPKCGRDSGNSSLKDLETRIKTDCRRLYAYILTKKRRFIKLV